VHIPAFADVPETCLQIPVCKMASLEMMMMIIIIIIIIIMHMFSFR